jgi:hypothetical protein
MLPEMSSVNPRALVLLRVSRGEPAPDDPRIRGALAEDRRRLGLGDGMGSLDYHLAGPYPILLDGHELDEYVAWET